MTSVLGYVGHQAATYIEQQLRRAGSTLCCTQSRVQGSGEGHNADLFLQHDPHLCRHAVLYPRNQAPHIIRAAFTLRAPNRHDNAAVREVCIW
jgi:hypothetical protein